MYLIARDTFNISPREGDNRRSHPGPLRENVIICSTQRCTTPALPPAHHRLAVRRAWQRDRVWVVRGGLPARALLLVLARFLVALRQKLSPGVSECRRCRAVSGSVGPVSGQCRLTLVSECRGVSGSVSGPVSGYVGLS